MDSADDNLHNTPLQAKVKRYYLEIERYDWVTDTKYPEKLHHFLRKRKVLSTVNKYVTNKNIALLDIGCGTGFITRHFQFDRITALDLNGWALQRARIHSSNGVNFIQGDAENLPIASNKFDVVICTEVLEHLIQPDSALKEIYRVMKPGALLIGTVPANNPIWKYRNFITTTCPVSEPFHNNFTKQEFIPLLEDFKIIKIQHCLIGLLLIFIVRKPTP